MFAVWLMALIGEFVERVGCRNDCSLQYKSMFLRHHTFQRSRWL